VIVANYLAAGALFCLGTYTVTTRRNLVKIVMGLSLVEASTYLLIVSMAYRRRSTAPVLTDPPAGQTVTSLVHARLADPVLQNFCLTAIVIGVAVTGAFLAVTVRIAQHYKTLDAAKVRELRG